ncbi:MAG TPA: flagellar motor switch protein FliG [Chloroflexota bacterium]|nr:flagellar motor switch protein FliG [Chloroflexota bacterium]
MVAAAMDTTTRSGARKAAILIVTLGGDLAAPLLKSLREEQIEAITREIVAMDHLPEEERDDVLERCYQAAHAPGTGWVGTEYARDILARSLGTRKAQDVLTRVGAGKGRAFDFVKSADIGQIVNYFQAEHPQTVALALGHMAPQLAGEILAGLPRDQQVEVAIRLAHTAHTDPEVVRGVEEAMRRKLRHFSHDHLRPAGGLDYLVEVLNTCDSQTERSILEAIGEADPDLAQELRDRMFTFQDIAILDDRSIQRLIREVDQKDLAIALRGASDEVRARIFRNLSSRARQSLAEDIDRFGPVRLRLVEEAQAKIVEAARRLQESEEIVVPRGRQDVFV